MLKHYPIEHTKSLAAFKAFMQQNGIRFKLEAAQRCKQWDGGIALGEPREWPADEIHKTIGLIRETAGSNSVDLKARYIGGEKDGALAHLTWPKAHEIEYLANSNGWCGFVITTKKYGVRLTYHFVE